MTWPLPEATKIAERLAAGYEVAFSDPENPDEIPDARSPNSVLAVLSRVPAMVLFGAYLYQRSLAEELMPDTAQEWLPRHGDVWGRPRLPATTAIGRVVFAGAAGLTLPARLELSSTAGRWITTAAATLNAQGSVEVAVAASAPGVAGNVAAGTVLALVSPVAGLTPQSATVGAEGIAGGAAFERREAWRARILERIRDPAHGGKAADYRKWAVDAGAAYVKVVPAWVGPGSVGVVVAMAGDAGPRAPTSDELARITAAIEAERPVTAQAVVVAAELLPVPFTLQATPDTLAVRSAIEAAIDAFFSAEAQVGELLPRSRISEGISAAGGEYAHRMILPSADVAPNRAQLPIPGVVTWQAWA